MKKEWLIYFLALILFSSCAKDPISCFELRTYGSGYTDFTSECAVDAEDFEWDFGDGYSSLEPNPAHTYGIGEYTATLKVRSSNGKTHSSSKPVSVKQYCMLCICLGIDTTKRCGTAAFVGSACSTCEDHAQCRCERL